MSEMQSMIEKSVRDTVQKHADEIRESAIKGAVAYFEKELRRLIGTVAIDLSNYFSIERSGMDLVIHVKLAAPEPKGAGRSEG